MASLLIIVFLVAMIIGVPIAFAIGISCVAVLLEGNVNLVVMAQRTFASIDSFSLLAVPYFILAGNLLSRGSMSKYLVEFAESFLGRIKGGLSIVSVVAGMFFAAISGSGSATTAAVGATMVPELKKRGYNEASSVALIAAAGTIGPVIPPSIIMVLYASIAEVSVTSLFANGFAPGIAMGLVLIIIALWQAHQMNYPKGPELSLKNIWQTFKKAILVLIMPMIILGGIFSGHFTATEAASVAVAYAFLITMFVYRDMTLKELWKILLDSALTTGMIMIIVGLSGAFGWVLANWKIPEAITAALIGISSNKYIIMFMISVVVIIAGIFLDAAASVIILTPVFLPLLETLGLNLVHFGVAFVIGLAVGMVTPPVAMNLFVGSSISGVPISRIAKAVMPYTIALFIVFFLYLYLPVFFPGMIIS